MTFTSSQLSWVHVHMRYQCLFQSPLSSVIFRLAYVLMLIIMGMPLCKERKMATAHHCRFVYKAMARWQCLAAERAYHFSRLNWKLYFLCKLQGCLWMKEGGKMRSGWLVLPRPRPSSNKKDRSNIGSCVARWRSLNKVIKSGYFFVLVLFHSFLHFLIHPSIHKHARLFNITYNVSIWHGLT